MFLLIRSLFVFSIMTKSSLFNILKDYCLNGNNYVQWKRKIGIVLQVDEITWVLDIPCPPAPNENSTDVEREIYSKWQRNNEMAKFKYLQVYTKQLRG